MQKVDATALITLEYMPAGQVTQLESELCNKEFVALSTKYVPAGQAVHVLAPDDSTYLPALQIGQTEAPMSEN